MRIRSIDRFRGFSIVLMVFFTLINRLAVLPDILQHNVVRTVHFGDFVLPMFLFASGMSIVFFAEKRREKKKSEYVLDVVERFGKLVFVSFLLSPFSAGEFFGMDEVMLNALLFVPSVILLAVPEIAIGAISVFVFVIYFLFANFSMLPDFSGHYLGGYLAALFYLPVMLCGVIAGKRILEKKNLVPLFVACVVGSGMLLALVFPDKMAASPSFMGLSVLLSLAFFMIINAFEKKTRGPLVEGLEYLGMKPIRYWVLMFVVFVIPITLYAVATTGMLPLGIGWIAAVLFSFAALIVLWAVSKVIDYKIKRLW